LNEKSTQPSIDLVLGLMCNRGFYSLLYDPDLPLFEFLLNEPDPFVSESLFLGHAFLAEKALLSRRLAKWCQDFSEGFLFYPVDHLKDGHFILKEPYQAVNVRCSNIARRLKGREIIFDSDLRELAAASMLGELPRVGYPSEAIIHSLYYTRMMKLNTRE